MDENKTLIDTLADSVDIPDEDAADGAQVEQEGEEVPSDESIIAALEKPSEAVQAALQKIVNEAVKKALARNTPKRTTVKADPITKEQFASMSYAERENLYNTNRPLYEKLKNS